MKRAVYLSAPGLVSCAGRNRDELYESCLKGYQGGIIPAEIISRGGRSKAEAVPAEKFPSGIIPEENLPRAVPVFSEPLFSAAYAEDTKLFRVMDAALEQLKPAVEKALAAYGPGKIGVCLGSCDNGSEASLNAHRKFLAEGSFPEDYSLRFQSAYFPAEFIARKFGLSGPVFTAATACASGASAIIRGAELIRAGFCDAVIAGGADIVSETVLSGFNALEALSGDITNPFSGNRNGINLGEGAAFFLLEAGENEDGVELLGAGESADAFHMTAPGPDGAGPAKAMKAALFDAGLDPLDIGYVNLHGTGTLLNDKAEALAMRAVFPAFPPASSTKPVTGHTLGAAGALEAAVCWMALTGKKGLPVHCWDGEGDRELPFLPGGPYDAAPSVCMSNSFAFGGCNVSLILAARKGRFE